MSSQNDTSTVTEASTSKEIVAGRIRIHYHDIGRGDPIICVHGGGPGATAWSNFHQNVSDLSAKNRVILFDMPGWGRSEFPDEAIDQEFIAWMGEVFKDFMDALSIEKADFISNSMGGQATMGLALKYPDRIKRMVLIGSQPTDTIIFQPTPQEAIQNIITYYSGDGPSVEKMGRIVRSMVFDQSLVTDELIQERYERSITPEAIDQATRKSKQKRDDYYFQLGDVTVPTLLIWGHNDRAGSLEVGLMQLKRFQDARMYLFANCGHWAQVDHLEEFNRVCLDFFRS